MNRRKLILICLVLTFFIAGIATYKFRPRNQGLYKVTILPTLDGSSTFPRSINDKGQVAGYLQFKNSDNHLFLWDKENGMRDLGLCNGTVSLNNAGQIASNFIDPNGNERAFIWDPNTGRTILPTLGGKKSLAFEINNKGQIIGYSETSNGIQHGFIWDNINGICDLTPNNTLNTIARAINDSGQVIVAQNSNVLLNVQGNKIASSITTPLSNLYKINNKGYVVGTIRNNQTKNLDLAIWNSLTNRTNIIKSNTGFSSYNSNINNSNQIIIMEINQYNYLFKKDQSYFKIKNYLHDPKLGLLSLEGYIDIEKDEEFGLNDINNNGWIIGTFGSEKEKDFKGVLFEPIAEKFEKLLKESKASK